MYLNADLLRLINFAIGKTVLKIQYEV